MEFAIEMRGTGGWVVREGGMYLKCSPLLEMMLSGLYLQQGYVGGVWEGDVPSPQTDRWKTHMK